MMRFLRWFFGLFSSYVHPFERKVDRFFRGINSRDSVFEVRRGLLKLMQENLIVLNLWMEKRFKGYLYLKKSVRRQMYADTETIVVKFREFAQLPVNLAQLEALLANKFTLNESNREKVIYLWQIMSFLRPGKNYQYIKTASFGKLLRDPSISLMEGDCNQIVTFYIYLYSLRFPVEDLQIKLLPEHVCLHFEGIDIEATAGVFQKYDVFDHILPVTEIISTNLLDLADFREEVQEISERMMLKSAQLAYAISSLKQIVEKNLKVAYRNLGLSFLKVNNFDSAMFYLSQVGDLSLMEAANRSAAIYYLNRKNFRRAKFFAARVGGDELMKSVRRAELVDEYQMLTKKVSGVKTLLQAKKFKSTYLKMRDLALKLDESELVQSLNSTLDQIARVR